MSLLISWSSLWKVPAVFCPVWTDNTEIDSKSGAGIVSNKPDCMKLFTTLWRTTGPPGGGFRVACDLVLVVSGFGCAGDCKFVPPNGYCIETTYPTVIPTIGLRLGSNNILCWLIKGKFGGRR